MTPAARTWPVLSSLKGWRTADLGGDVVAALTLVAIAIPEQMATARLGAFPPSAGFWVFVAGSLSVALFSANRVLSVGADSTITPIFAGTLAAFAAAGTAQYHDLAALLALMVGVLVVLSGVFRLGWIANLLSVPVTTGFLAGIAVHIAVSQLPGLLGLTLPRGDLFATLAAVAGHRGEVSGYAVAIGLFVFAATTISERIDKRIPAAVIAVIVATLAVMAFGLDSRGVPVLGTLAPGLPQLAMPRAEIGEVAKLLPLAILVSFVVLLQTAATDRSFSPQRAGGDVNRDYVGTGVASLVSGVLGGFAANASPPRTAAVAESGGRSGLTNLLAAALVALFAIFGMRLLSHVPDAALAGLLFFVARRIVRVPVFAAAWRQTKAEFALIVATAAAIVAMPIATGVGIGITLSILHGVWTITRAGMVAFARVPGTTIWWPRSVGGEETVPGISVIGFQAPLFFLNAQSFRKQFDQLDPGARTKLVVLEASNVVEIDFSGAEALTDLIRDLKGEGRVFAIARLESVRARAALERFGIVALLGPDRIYLSVEDAVRAWQGKAVSLGSE